MEDNAMRLNPHNPPGVLVEIEGTDASGKETQARFLVDRLNRHGYDAIYFEFPMYGDRSAAAVEKYLDPKDSFFNDLFDSYQGSLPYAVDRLFWGPTILGHLISGRIVILNRYVDANLAHQGCKTKNSREFNHFRDWLYDLEFVKNKLPKPDLKFVLYVKPEISMELARKRAKETNIALDNHEIDYSHQFAASETYKKLPEYFSNCTLINCARNEQMRSRQEIHYELWQIIINKLDPQEFIHSLS